MLAVIAHDHDALLLAAPDAHDARGFCQRPVGS